MFRARAALSRPTRRKISTDRPRLNGRGYVLTFGLHTPRIRERVQVHRRRGHAGNIYVNRNQIVPPWSGRSPLEAKGCRGQGPKGRRPHYLRRLPARSSYGRAQGWRRAVALRIRLFPKNPPKTCRMASRGNWAGRGVPGWQSCASICAARQPRRSPGRRARILGPVDLPGADGAETKTVKPCSRADGFSCFGPDAGDDSWWQCVHALGAGNAGGWRWPNGNDRPQAGEWARACPLAVAGSAGRSGRARAAGGRSSMGIFREEEAPSARFAKALAKPAQGANRFRWCLSRPITAAYTHERRSASTRRAGKAQMPVFSPRAEGPKPPSTTLKPPPEDRCPRIGPALIAGILVGIAEVLATRSRRRKRPMGSAKSCGSVERVPSSSLKRGLLGGGTNLKPSI